MLAQKWLPLAAHLWMNCLFINHSMVQGELAGQTLAALPSRQVAELSQHGSKMGQMLSETFALTAETGSYRYMAPEVFRHEAYNHKVAPLSLPLLSQEPLPQGTRPRFSLDSTRWSSQTMSPLLLRSSLS